MDLNCRIKLSENEMELCKKKAINISNKIKLLLNSSKTLEKIEIETYQKEYSNISENMKKLQKELTKLYTEKSKTIQLKTQKLNSYKNITKDCHSNPVQLKLAMSKISF